MKDFTVDDFIRFKNLEFKMEQMKEMNDRRLTMKDTIEASENICVSVDKTDIDEIAELPFEEIIEKFIQEFLNNNNNKKGEK